MARLLALVDRQPTTSSGGSTSWALEGVCWAASEALEGSGAGITMMGGDGWRGVVAVSGSESAQREELQFVCGEGPCIDAFRLGHPVLVDDLEDRLWATWTGYASVAQAAGIRAVFAFPLQVGAARIGVMDVYRDSVGPLLDDELADALALAEIAVVILLNGQQAALPGHSASGLEDALDYRVYQAQGMISVQLRVDLIEAMSRLRAYALAHDRRLGDVAVAVLDNSLHLGREDL